MKRKNNASPVYIVAFTVRLNDGCDYASQTIQRLSQSGHVYGIRLGEPISWRTLLTLHPPPITQNLFGATIIRPLFLIPGQRNHFIRNLNNACNALLIRIYVSLVYPKNKKYFWFFEPFDIPLLMRIFFGFNSVYDCVDYFYDFSSHARNNEQYILSNATDVFANSKTLQLHLKQTRKDVKQVPLGFAEPLFCRHGNVHVSRFIHKKLIVGYVGGIDSRLDISLLTEVALACPTIQFEFYGKIYQSTQSSPTIAQDAFKVLSSLPNVCFRGEVLKSNIPAIIDSFDVSIIPYRIDNTFNTHCFPMKVMEYLYVGKPILSTPIHELHKYKDVISISNSPSRWIELLKDNKFTKINKQQKDRMRSIAVSHTWSKKVNQILSSINHV